MIIFPGILRGRGLIDPDAMAVMSRMSTPPSTTNAGAINTLVKGLKTAGVWNKLDALQIYAAHDSQAALLDWKRSSVSATLHGGTTPVHYANRHFYSAGSPAYLNTKFNPSTATLFQQNDCTYGFYNDQGNLGSVYSGITTSALTRMLFVHATPRLNGSLVSVSGSDTNSPSTGSSYGRISGICSATRTSSASYEFHLRGTSLGTITSTSGSRPNAEFFVFANNNSGTAANFGANKIAAFFAGQALTSTELTAFNTAMDVYLTTVGGLEQRVVCWGDSLTFNTNGGAFGTHWREQIEQGGTSIQPGVCYRWVRNEGAPAESSTAIHARMAADTTYNDHIQIIWAGRNDTWSSQTVRDKIAAMVDLATARSGKFLVLSVPNGQIYSGSTSNLKGITPNWEDAGEAVHDDLLELNQDLSDAYGTYYVDVWSPMVATGTAGEQARQVTPLACLVDPIHHNATAHGIFGPVITAKIASLGW